MLKNIETFMAKPEPYAPSTAKFWDDEHISKGMLESHLNPDWDAATRKHAFVRQSVEWISKAAPVQDYRTLLDLGCGPGIYAELFHKAGYQVAGLDLSERSISYAKESAETHGLPITYEVCNYLTLDYAEQFDVVTLINYDFGVLSTENRAKLLAKIHTALTPNGLFIFDVFTPNQYSGLEEYKQWEYSQNGFFSAEPHLCLNSFYRYDEQNTFLQQHLIVTDQDVKCYNIWEHTFTESELSRDLDHAGFKIKGLYGDIAGAPYDAAGKTLCVVAEKQK
ncbi:MAG: class I SAM-dependent methyltransferase [Clostridia bacterium]|nr:class I SAM-dependent methyltransferase [Clostridia bacterium]